MNDELINTLASALNGIDVHKNLNSIESISNPLVLPRLGRLADIPKNSLADSIELNNWEMVFRQGGIGALIAIKSVGIARSDKSFLNDWLNSTPDSRIFITYHVNDHSASLDLQQQLTSLDYEVKNSRISDISQDNQNPARFYATAGQRLVLETKSARESRTEVQEFLLLNRSQQKNEKSVFPKQGELSRYYQPDEPERFLKADLGSESEEATIPEILVSGGIAFGEIAQFSANPKAMLYSDDKRFRLQMADDSYQLLPSLDPKTLKACFDFAVRSIKINSHAIVDIDARKRVSISSAFKNTNSGFELVEIDSAPYQFVKNISSRKSIILDTDVKITKGTENLVFNTEYEIRFISRDKNKIALNRAALVYEYNTDSDLAVYSHAWGPYAFRINHVNYEKLGERTKKSALYAGWTALFRKVENSDIDFSHGRYEFMKIDKTGKKTPKRSRK